MFICKQVIKIMLITIMLDSPVSRNQAVFNWCGGKNATPKVICPCESNSTLYICIAQYIVADHFILAVNYTILLIIDTTEL